MSLQLAFEEAGAGPPVVILHGLFGSGTNWRSVARALAPQHRVLCVDLRNHGASPWIETMGYLDMAADVRALIRTQKLKRPLLVGHSMGGKTAMALALEDGRALGGLVVVDIAPVSYGDRMSPFVSAMAGLGPEALASRSQAQRLLAQAVPDAGVVPFLLQNLVPRNEHFEWRLNLAAIGAAVHELSGFPESLAGHRYGGPTTLIHGTRSDYVTAADLPRCAEMFPALRVEAIEGAGHWVHADRPAEFIAALQRAADEATPA